MSNKLITGTEVICHINNSPFALCANIAFNSETPRKNIYSIDSLQPVELLQGPTQCGGTLQVYRLKRSGGIEGAGLSAHFNDLIKEKYFSILLIDRSTDSVLFRADSCSVISQSWNVGRNYVLGTISFSALNWSNEVQPIQVD